MTAATSCYEAPDYFVPTLVAELAVTVFAWFNRDWLPSSNHVKDIGIFNTGLKSVFLNLITCMNRSV